MQRGPNPALFLAITCAISIGFAVKGAVDLILGLLALLAGLGERGGRVTDTHGAIATLLCQPFGRLVVAVLALDAGRLALRWRAGGGTNPSNTIIASPLAPWLVTLVGIGIIVYAATEIRRALAPRFSERLNIGRVAREAGQLIVGIGRAGIAARAVVMAALGAVLLRARSAAAAAGSDMADSLRLVAALPSGVWGLTLVAAGLMAYGVYMVVHARYRRITAP